MADPATGRSAPPTVIDATQDHDQWIFRAVDKRENIVWIIGGDTLVNARRQARELIRQGMLAEEPIRKEDRTWRI